MPLMLGIAIGIVLVDQCSKAAMLHLLQPGQTHPLIGDWFRLRLLFNSGAAFSIGSSMTWIFTTIQLVFVVGILGFVSRRITVTSAAVYLAMIAGGAAGNLCDRLFRAPGFFVGHVVDFISVGSFAVFNIADSFITVGVALLIIAMIRHPETFEDHKPDTTAAAAANTAQDQGVRRG
nr:signal peptidase II [Corynebacterium choanae]